jgi:hypothetical protein
LLWSGWVDTSSPRRRWRVVTVGELLEAVFSVGSASKLYHSTPRGEQLIVRQSPASKAVKTEAELSTVLEAVTRQPVKTQQTEKI